MKKKKKLLAVLLMAALCLGVLTGCGHTHEWAEADCTTPKTCTDCGETEGEALGHSWADATCSAPRTCNVCGLTEGDKLAHQFSDATCTEASACTVCGETEGEPLGHSFTEANYQSPALCTVCGTAEGEPLTPDFITYGIDVDLSAVGDTTTYTTVSNKDSSIEVIGTTTLTSYDIYPSFEEIEEREGYECRVAVFTTKFGADAFSENGVRVAVYFADYYDIGLFLSEPDHSNELYSANTVNFNGEEQRVYTSQLGEYDDQDGTLTFTFTVCAQVPIGYDGYVCGLVRGGLCTPDDDIRDFYSPEDFVLFRMGN